jgi:hypothetical protein
MPKQEGEAANKRPRYLLPTQWILEESFWREITTRTVSGGLVVVIGYIYGVGAGTIPAPTNKNIVFDVLVVCGVFIVTTLIYVNLTYSLFRAVKDSKPNEPFSGALKLMGVIVLVGFFAFYIAASVAICALLIETFS